MVSWFQRHAERFALLTGAGLVVAGVHQIHEPSAMILAGVLLMAGVLWRRDK